MPIIGLVVFVLLVSALLVFNSAKNSPPPQIVANFTDLSKIEKVSRFRSCAGHLTVPQDERESKRNMKHYFWVKPEFNKEKTVEIFAPYNGFVSTVRSDPADNLEGEIWITPNVLPPMLTWSFSVQHIDVREGLKRGDQVKAGELIGFAALSEKRGDSFDIVYGKAGIPVKTIDNWTDPFSDLDSVFNHMSSKVADEYLQKGVTSIKDFITSKEARDHDPCVYQGQGPYFANQEAPTNWVYLTK